MRFKNLLLIQFFLFSYLLTSAGDMQCGFYEIPLNQRVVESNFIFEGKVINKTCFWNSEKNLIYTSNMIEVLKVFKGVYLKTHFIINSQGGSLDGQFHKATPTLELSEGETGIFFANGTSISNPKMPQDIIQLETFAGVQGFIKYNLYDQSATEPFKSYSSFEKTLYPEIKNLTGNSYTEIKKLILNQAHEQKTSASPVISSFSPSTITAGTFSILTINGSGFGSSASGPSGVYFKNADNGGINYISALSSQIVSWSDNLIQVKVPQHAGTGTIQVMNSSNASAASSATLTVTYNLINLQQNNIVYRPVLSDDSGAGGFSFQYASSFFNNGPAVICFQRGLDAWRCGSFVNFNSGVQNGSISCAVQDGTNLVSFDDAGGCSLPAGYLGQAFVYYGGCPSGPNMYVFANEIDFKFSKAPTGGWNFGPSATSGGKYDLQSTTTHEIGHAMQLDHIIDFGKVMHFALASNTDIRNLNPTSDIAAGNDVMSLSTVTNPCGPPPMISLNAGNCATITVGIEKTNTESRLVSNPQPSTGSVEFHIPEQMMIQSPQSLLIYNVLGEVILQKEVNTNLPEINISNQTTGIYFYRLIGSEKELAKGKIYLVR